MIINKIPIDIYFHELVKWIFPFSFLLLSVNYFKRHLSIFVTFHIYAK